MGQPGVVLPKAVLDQFGTFEVFVQPREGKPFQHEGVVHAPDIEMAFILAKEAFTRRFTCSSLYVADTRHVFVSPFTDGGRSAYEMVTDPGAIDQPLRSYEIYHLVKRGKQHVHATTVEAANAQHAMFLARDRFAGKVVYNIWSVCTADIRFTKPEERELWLTLPEKKFRDAAEYKGGEKLKAFLDQRDS